MGKFSKYNIPLKTLSNGTYEYEYQLDKQFFADMDSADIRDAALDVKVTVKYDGVAYDLDFVIKGEITILCDRCLDEMQWPIDATYHITVKYGDDYRDDSDDVIEIPYRDTQLNVSYMIYDTVTLAIPIKHVHPVGQCNKQMSALLRRHSCDTAVSDEDADLENRLIDEMDDMADSISGSGDNE